MKYIKILIMMISAAALTTSCSDDEDTFNINTSAATVQFSETSVSLMETVNYIDLPIVINGSSRDGFIKINVAINSNPSEFDLDSEVVITSYEFMVPADRQNVNFEVGLHVETLDTDRGRNISFEITSVEGATLGENTTCAINIIEKNPAVGGYGVRGNDPVTGDIAIIKQEYLFFISEDQTYENMRVSLGMQEHARVTFTEIIADAEYNIEIEPFHFMGKYMVDKVQRDIYLTWIKYNGQTKRLEYDEDAPIRGRFVRRISNDKESVTITLDDGIGVGYFNEYGEFEWFENNCFRSGAVLTKNQ